METKTMTETAKAFAIKRVLHYVDKNPDKTLPKILDWIEKHDTRKVNAPQVNAIRSCISDPNSNWNCLLKSLWEDIDDQVRLKTFENFIINATVYGNARQYKAIEEYNCNIPWAILMDPTSACNLHCDGCWAAEYGPKLNLSYETLDNIIRQGQEVGTCFYIFSGGEPLVRKKDIIRLCEEHTDCQFLAFTNGTLIDEEFANDMLRVKNFIPAISIEGFEETTDARRGKGTFAKVVQAMDLLKSKKLPFGVSVCYTSQNTEVVGSEEFYDFLIEKGAKFAWFFTFMPVGVGSPKELMASPEQRRFMYEQIRKFRKTKPLFTLDFWNDGEYINGCIAGGRCYLHINANGDIEPCAFIHYADSNIHEHTLTEAYQRPLFMAYRRNRPFNKVHLRPCPLLDNPEALAAMIDCSGAHSTDMFQPEDVHDLCAKCHNAADNWAPVAQELWDNWHYVSGNKR